MILYFRNIPLNDPVHIDLSSSYFHIIFIISSYIDICSHQSSYLLLNSYIMMVFHIISQRLQQVLHLHLRVDGSNRFGAKKGDFQNVCISLCMCNLPNTDCNSLYGSLQQKQYRENWCTPVSLRFTWSWTYISKCCPAVSCWQRGYRKWFRVDNCNEMKLINFPRQRQKSIYNVFELLVQRKEVPRIIECERIAS